MTEQVEKQDIRRVYRCRACNKRAVVDKEIDLEPCRICGSDAFQFLRYVKKR